MQSPIQGPKMMDYSFQELFLDNYIFSFEILDKHQRLLLTKLETYFTID